MTLPKYRLTTLLVLVSVLCCIVIYLQLAGYLVDFVITDVVTVGLTHVQIEKIIDQQNYALAQLMR